MLFQGWHDAWQVLTTLIVAGFSHISNMENQPFN